LLLCSWRESRAQELRMRSALPAERSHPRRLDLGVVLVGAAISSRGRIRFGASLLVSSTYQGRIRLITSDWSDHWLIIGTPKPQLDKVGRSLIFSEPAIWRAGFVVRALTRTGRPPSPWALDPDGCAAQVTGSGAESGPVCGLVALAVNTDAGRAVFRGGQLFCPVRKPSRCRRGPNWTARWGTERGVER